MINANTTQILMFHRILPQTPTAFGLPDCYRLRGTALTESEFLQALEEYAPIIPLEAVENALRNNQEIPRGSVVTFDDGYREHLDVVTPILTARQETATFYIATGIHANTPTPKVAIVDAWYWLLDHAQNPSAQVQFPDGSIFEMPLDTHESKMEWVQGAPKKALLDATPTQQQTMLKGLVKSVNQTLPQNLAEQLYLHQAEWSQLAKSNMRVGAHTITHPRLTQISDYQQSAEITGSIATISQLTNPVPFSYPDGNYDERIANKLHQTLASSAVTCEHGHICPNTDLMKLPRIFITSQ